MTASTDPESRPPGVKSLDKSLSLSVTQFFCLANADTNNSNPYLRELLWWLNEFLHNQGHLSLLHLVGIKVTKFPALTPIWTSKKTYVSLHTCSVCVGGECLFECWKEPLFPLIIGWLQSNKNFTLKLATPATKKITETPSFIRGALSENLHPCSKILEIRMDNWDSGWSGVNKDALIKFCIGTN